MSDIEILSSDLELIEKELYNLEEYLEILLKMKNLENLTEKISLLDSARLNAAIAYTLNSIYFVYMKLNGIPIENHKINQENERIQLYIKKIEDSLNIKSEEEHNNISVNKNALRRIIKTTVSANEEIKKASKINRDKSIEKEVSDWKNTKIDNTKTFGELKDNKKLLKGALMPSTKHLNWKEKIDKIMKE